MGYYFAIDGESVGPLDHDQIESKIAEGKIQLETLAWKEGMESWKSVSEIPELLSDFPNLSLTDKVEPPPLPSSLPPKLPSRESKSELAEFGPRVVAGLIDNFVCLVPVLIVSQLVPYFISAIGIYAAYYIYFMSDKGGGQTWGYKAVKLKLVDQRTKRPVPVDSMIIWYLVYAFLGLIGWIWFFTDDSRRMLHNIASNTIVVKVGRG